MKRKILFAVMLVALSPLTHAASRCVNLIDKHVNQATLDLSNCDLHDNDLTSIASYLQTHPQITTLDISNNYRLFSNENADALAKNTTLKEINANSTMNYVSAGNVLNTLFQIHTLKKLSVEDDGLTDPDLSIISLGIKYNALQDLDIANNKKITEAGLAPFVQTNVWLHRLNLTGLPVSNRIANYFRYYADINSISIGDGGTQLDFAQLQALSSILTLTDLHLSGFDLSDRELTFIVANPHITSIGINDTTSLANKNCAAFVTNPNITSLELNNDQSISDDCLKYLAALPSLSTLSVNKTSILGDGFKFLKNSRNLKILYFKSFNRPISIHEISQIKSLTTLYIDLVKDLNDDDLKALVANTQISTLNINAQYWWNACPTAGLQALVNDSRLVNLGLINFHCINDDIAILLSSNKNLKTLDISGEKLTEAVLSYYADSHLDKLNIANNAFDPYGKPVSDFLKYSSIPTVQVDARNYLAAQKGN